MNSSQVASRESTVAPNGSLGEPGDRLHENQLGPCVGTSDGTRRPAGVAATGKTALAVPLDNGQAPACLTYSPFIRANARLRGHPSSQSADPAGESLQVSAHIGIVDQNRWGRGHRQGVRGSNPLSSTRVWMFEPRPRLWPGICTSVARRRAPGWPGPTQRARRTLRPSTYQRCHTNAPARSAGSDQIRVIGPLARFRGF